MAAKFPVVTSVAATGHYRLHVGFSDGAAGDVDLSDLRDAGGVFEPLRDPGYFARAYVDAGAGTVCWPNGADLAPDVLHDEITGRRRRPGGLGAISPGMLLVMAAVTAAAGLRALTRNLTR